MLGISTVGAWGDQSGYTIINFAFLYIVGALLHKWNVLEYSKSYDLLGYVVCTLFVFLGKKLGLSMWDYSNCILIASSIFLFNFFRKTKMSFGKLDNCILWFAKACFGVYIIHTKAIIQETFWDICSFWDMSNGSLGAVVGNYTICIMATFILCVLIDSLYRFLIDPLLKKVEKRKIVIDVE